MSGRALPELTVMIWMPNILAFAAVAVVIVCTPGPNMIYLVSRSISQGPRAGLQSLIGTAMAFLLYMVLAVLGISAMLIAVPFAYDTLRIVGAAYLLWLAWKAVRPGGSPFEVRRLESDPPRQLIFMGFMTNLLNPKAAALYLSLMPQFIDPRLGHVIEQGLLLGLTQIAISVAFNALFIVTAGTFARVLRQRPSWALVQRLLMGTVLSALAVRMLAEARR